MLDIKFVRENPELVKENIKKKFQDEKLPLVDEVIRFDAEARKAQLEANIQRAKTACRILATMGVLPLAPHLYFTQFLKDEDAQERATGIRFGMEWLEAADEVWVFGESISEGMAAEIKRAYELKKPVRNLPEPGRMVELLLKRLSEQYHIPMEGKTEEQQEAAESEKDNGE